MRYVGPFCYTPHRQTFRQRYIYFGKITSSDTSQIRQQCAGDFTKISLAKHSCEHLLLILIRGEIDRVSEILYIYIYTKRDRKR